MAQTALIKQLLEAGVHFGHQTRRWNPKMKQFIFSEKNGIYVIDLEQTAERITRAAAFLREVASRGEPVLFVGCKKQAQDIIREEAKRCGMPFVTKRWLGGTLTNFATIRKSIKRMNDIGRMQTDGTFEHLAKKERMMLLKEEARHKLNLEGIADMERMPGAVFVIDAKHEDIAVREARRLSIPVVAVIDTNTDPDRITYPIPANDDAIKSIRLLTTLMTEAIMEGRQAFAQGRADAAAAQAAALAGDAIEEESKVIAEEIAPEDKAVKEERKPPKGRTKIKRGV